MHPLTRVIACLVLFLWSSLALAQTAVGLKGLDAESIDSYIGRQMKEKDFVGLSLGVMRDGKVVLAKGYGKASLETGAAVDVDTRFGIGSVTKQFTCACILLLAADGKLSINDKVAQYYPDLTRAKDITLYDLMTHVSGYADYYPLDFVDRRMHKAIAIDQVIRDYAGGRLDFEPGARYSYSNTGYLILGRIVEKVSGQSFARFLEQRILRPLGMTNTVFEPAKEAGRLARGYTCFALGAPEPATLEADGWIHAAGGLYSTPTDLLLWDLALMEGKILKPESYKLMSAPRKLADGKMRNYGCGLGISQRDGETLLRHSGAVSGYLAFNTLIPRTRSAVVLLTNGDYMDAASVNNEILSLLLKEQSGGSEIPRVRGPSPRDAAVALLRQMQTGALDRSKLGEEFSVYMSEERVRGAASRLKELGEPIRIEIEDTSERGGMEVVQFRLTFKTAKAKAYLYRTPDGKIQQFLLYKG